MAEETDIVKVMRIYGLFLAPLGNGNWMAGKANVIYHLDITSDHYLDDRLSIHSNPEIALQRAIRKTEEEK